MQNSKASNIRLIIVLLLLCLSFLYRSNAQAKTTVNTPLELQNSATIDTDYILKTTDWLDELLNFHSVQPYSNNKIQSFNNVLNNVYDWSLAQETNTKHISLLHQKLFFYHYRISSDYAKAVQLGENLLLKDDYIKLKPKREICGRLKRIYLRIGYLHKYIEMIGIEKSIISQLNPNEKHGFEEFSDLAKAYLLLKNYDEAISNYKTQLGLFDETDYYGQSSILNNLGYTFFNAKQYDSAYYYYNKAISQLKKHTPNAKEKQYVQHFLNVIEANKAEIDVINGNYTKGIEAYKKEINSAEAVGEFNISASGKNNLAFLYYLQGNYNDALQLLKQAESDIHKIHDVEALSENLNLKAKINLAQGHQATADHIFEIRQQLTDSISKAKTKNLTEVAAILYETNLKDSAIKAQKLQLSEQKNELLNAAYWRWILILIIFSIVVLLIITYVFFKRLKLQKEQIESQKILVDNSLKQKEIMLKEIHHRIKNNLQIVSSLLEKQGHIANDPTVKRIMKDSQSRIQSIALVHQKLYQIEDFKSIDFNDYATEIVTKIAQTFKLKGVEIIPVIEIPNVQFNIDTIIPLGLILNELITNCYKYAFQNRSHGNIWVILKATEMNSYELRIEDNGIGFQKDMEKTLKNTIGIAMVKGLAWQLKGQLKYYHKANKTTFIVTFKID